MITEEYVITEIERLGWAEVADGKGRNDSSGERRGGKKYIYILHTLVTRYSHVTNMGTGGT